MHPTIIILLVVTLLAVVVVSVGGAKGNALTLTLERASHKGFELNQLNDRDRVRHGRLLRQEPSDTAFFPVTGTHDPDLDWLYYTRIQLGTPPKEFFVEIDTGSNEMWINCSPCTSCPTSSSSGAPLHYFDPNKSSTARPISCSEELCSLGADYYCNNENKCGYNFQYRDGSEVSGYLVSDSMYLDLIENETLNSASVVFGCSTSQTGENPQSPVVGKFGLGKEGMSVISQLHQHGITPNVFFHCLAGGFIGIGDMDDTDMIFTPLIPTEPHYNVNLQSIVVSGTTTTPSGFATSGKQGTIIDSGTALAYLEEKAYNFLVNAITRSVSDSLSVHPQLYKGNQCFQTTQNVSRIFPTISLNFADNASMILNPQDYLLQQSNYDVNHISKHPSSPINGPHTSDDKYSGYGKPSMRLLTSNKQVETKDDIVTDAALWCIGIKKNERQGMTILGDLVLKNKIVMYDLDGQRIGWSDFDCSTLGDSPPPLVIPSSAEKTSCYASAHNKLIKLVITSTVITFLFHRAIFFGVIPLL